MHLLGSLYHAMAICRHHTACLFEATGETGGHLSRRILLARSAQWTASYDAYSVWEDLS